MPEQTDLPTRKSPAHPPPVERFNEPVVVLVTVCAKSRQDVFANVLTHDAIRLAWKQARQWSVGPYTLMPDHVHLFCVPGVPHPEGIKIWVGYWKRLVSVSNPHLKDVWLRDTWDTQMRSREHYSEKCSYVAMNPVRRGLAATPEDWPFSGCMTPVMW